MSSHLLYLPFTQAVSTCKDTTKDSDGYKCQRRRRVFCTKCSRELLCDMFAAAILAVYTGDKQLGIVVSWLCVNRCLINHGPANKASPSWGPALHPPARKEGWMEARGEDRHPDSERHMAAHRVQFGAGDDIHTTTVCFTLKTHQLFYWYVRRPHYSGVLQLLKRRSLENRWSGFSLKTGVVLQSGRAEMEMFWNNDGGWVFGSHDPLQEGNKRHVGNQLQEPLTLLLFHS